MFGEPQKWESGDRSAEPEKFLGFFQWEVRTTREKNIYNFLIKMGGKSTSVSYEKGLR